MTLTAETGARNQLHFYGTSFYHYQIAGY